MGNPDTSRGGTVVITGAGGNLGAAVAAVLANGGARLACLDRSRDKLDRLVADLPRGTEILPIAGVDLTSSEACSAAIAEVTERFGAISALVNTVGGFQAGPVATRAPQQFESLLTTNARTAFAISAAVLPAMQRARYGRIVHIAAMAGLKAPAGLAAYAASKAAVMRLTESIAEEYRADGITANCVLPSTIDTPQNRAAMPKADMTAWVTPQAIGRLIAFLVSPAGGVVTGAAIPATGTSGAG